MDVMMRLLCPSAVCVGLRPVVLLFHIMCVLESQENDEATINE